MTSTDAWDAPGWATIRAAGDDVDRLVALLRTLRASCDAAMPLSPRTAAFDPASGWQTADGLLGLLEDQCAIPAGPGPRVTVPPSPAAAAVTVEDLFRAAADVTLHAAQSLPDPPDPRRAIVLATVMRQLQHGFLQVFGRPW